MAAFIYRHAGSPAYVPEVQSPFVHIPTNHNFYKQISWLASTEISNGWTEPDDAKTFRGVHRFCEFKWQLSCTATGPRAERHQPEPRPARTLIWIPTAPGISRMPILGG